MYKSIAALYSNLAESGSRFISQLQFQVKTFEQEGLFR